MSEGEHIFFSDIDLVNQFYGVLVRSHVKAGRLKEILPPEMPEGYFLITASDIPGKNAVEINGGQAPIFADGLVSYIGEPVGIIAGPDYEAAADIAQKTHLVIEEIIIDESEQLDLTQEAFLEITEQKGDTTPFFPAESQVLENEEESEDEGIAAKESSDTKDEDAIEEGENVDGDEANSEESEPLIITETFAEVLPAEYSRIERLGAIANYEENSIEVYTATLWAFHAKKTVAEALALPLEKIAVIPTYLGEAHEWKIWTPSLAASQAAVAAFKCKRPVKLIFSHNEELSYLPKMPPAKIRIKSASIPDGKIKAMEADIEINCGSAAPFASEISARAIAIMQEFYGAENAKTFLRLAKSNLPPMMPESDFAESYAFMAIETHMDALSRKLNIFPDDARRATGNIKDEKYFHLMEEVCKSSSFARKYAAYETLNRGRSSFKDSPVRGIGLSLACQKSGFLSAWPEGVQYSVEITMEKTSEVHIRVGFHSSSIKEIICAMTADSLGIDRAQISFSDEGTDSQAFGGPDILSSATAIVLPLVSRCCSSIQRQRFRKPLPITVKKTYKPSKPDLLKRYKNSFTPVSPAACTIELELNPLDWTTRVRGIWIACSAGKLLDKNAAESAIKKACKEALARLSFKAVKIEDGKFCGAGRLGLESPIAIPEADIKVSFLESKEIPRGIGNIAQNLLPAAYCSAIMQITGSTEVKVPVDALDIYSCFSGGGET